MSRAPRLRALGMLGGFGAAMLVIFASPLRGWWWAAGALAVFWTGCALGEWLFRRHASVEERRAYLEERVRQGLD